MISLLGKKFLIMIKIIIIAMNVFYQFNMNWSSKTLNLGTGTFYSHIDTTHRSACISANKLLHVKKWLRNTLCFYILPCVPLQKHRCQSYNKYVFTSKLSSVLLVTY